MQDSMVGCKITGEKMHLNIRGAWWEFQGIDKRNAEGMAIQGGLRVG